MAVSTLTLELYSVGDESTLALLRKIDTKAELRVDSNSCFWLGSVSTDHNEDLQKFLSAAEREALLELKEQNAIEVNMVYAILVQDASSIERFHLFIIQFGKGLWDDLRIVFAKPVSAPLSVVPKTKTALPRELVPEPKLELWKTFIGGFFGK